MVTTYHNTVVGVFDDHTKAREAIGELKSAGFRDDQIGVVSHDRDRIHEGAEEGDAVASGALAGAAAGAGLGAAWGLGIMAGLLPAIGPVIAGGTLAAILASAATGAAAAGLVGALVGMGLSKEEAEYYHDEFRAGRTIVTVQAGDRAADARMIFERFGAYDFERSRFGGIESDTIAPPAHRMVDVPVTRHEVTGGREAGIPSDSAMPEIPPPVTDEPRHRGRTGL